MVQSPRPSIQIDLNEFKLHRHLKSRTQLTLHFNSPSRRFYLSVIALVVHEMKKLGKIQSIPLQGHLDLLGLLNESIGESVGSSDKEILLHRIYAKWKDALPNLEEAPLFKVLGKKKEEGDGAIGKIYSFTDAEKDEWANLFEYMGSNENVRLKFAIDKIGVGLNETSIIFEDSVNGDAWDHFISSLKKDGKVEPKREEKESEPEEKDGVSEPPAVPLSFPQQPKISWLTQYRWVLLIAMVGIVVGAVAVWRVYLSPPLMQVASVDRMKYPLPDVPSIAVLPFVNMSEDPKQEFLSDGITESIITALSKVPRLFVIAKNSTFTYKGKSVQVKQVSEDLGVQYVLEGSVQRSGDRIRITAQLIDALTGNHLWAERYDRDLKDLFALQDEITLKILTGVKVKLEGGEVLSAQKYADKYYRGKQGLECYLKLTEAAGYFRLRTIEDNILARHLIEEAIAMCPENPFGYVSLGWCYWNDWLLGNKKSPREALEKGAELAQKALAMDESLGEAQALLAQIYINKGELEKGIAGAERAVALSPGSWGVHHTYATGLRVEGRPGEAISEYQQAIRLNPFGPSSLYTDFGHALRDTGRFEAAVSAYRKAILVDPNYIYAHVGLTSTYNMMGREKEARTEAAEVLRINPRFSVDFYAKIIMAYKDQSEQDKIINALRKAGLK